MVINYLFGVVHAAVTDLDGVTRRNNGKLRRRRNM